MQLPTITADHSIIPATQSYISLSKKEMRGNLRSMAQASGISPQMMPKSTQHTLITWIPESREGKREATNLNKITQNYSVLIAPDSLNSEILGNYMSLIVVGHKGEFTEEPYKSLVQLVKNSQCKWVVLANCESGIAEYRGTLQNNELWPLAQKLANELNIKVSGTTRMLTFDEVGKGYAFALTLNEILIRSNPLNNNGPSLWKDFQRQSGIEEITDGLERL